VTIHKRRGSGYGLYWTGIALGLVGVVAVIVLAASDRLAFDGSRAVLSIIAVVVVLGVLRVVTSRR
jgi:hypothetical protein